MLYRPNQALHSIKSTLPHGYQAPAQTHHHHGLLGLIFSIVGFIVADIVVDLVVGLFAPAALPELDAALGTLEETAITGEIAADATEEAVENTSLFARAGRFVRKGAQKIGKKLGKIKEKYQAPAKAFWTSKITTPLGRSAYLLSRVAGKTIAKLLAFQTTSGISSEDGKFTYNKSVWTNASSWGFNSLFALSSVAKLGKLALGKFFMNTFQVFLRVAGEGSDLIKPYEEIMEMLSKKRELYQTSLGFKTVLKLIKNGDIDKLYGFFNADEIFLMKSFRRKLINKTLKSEERRFYHYKFWGFYLKFHDELSKVGKLRYIKQVKDIFWDPIHVKINLQNIDVYEEFDRWWQKTKSGYANPKIRELEIEAIYNSKNYDYIFKKFLRENGLHREYANKYKILYSFVVTKGAIGKFLGKFDKLEAYFGLTKDTWLEARNGFRGLLRKLYIRTSELTVTGGLDLFENIIFQYLTSPLYGLERIPYVISRNLIRAARKVKWIDEIYNKRFFELQLNKYLKANNSDFHFNKYEKEAYYKVQNTWFNYRIGLITKKEFREELYRDKNVDIFDGVIRKLLGKTNIKIDRFARDIGISRNNESFLTRLKRDPEFIAFRRSSILGVKIHNLNNYAIPFHDTELLDRLSQQELNQYKTVFGTKKFLNGRYDWTIFFATHLRKAPITQYNVSGRLVKNFITCGWGGFPREPWPYYNRYIAFGKEFTAFLKGGFSTLAGLSPETSALVRYYGLDIYSATEAYSGKTDFVKLGRSLNTPTVYEKIVLYTQIRLALGGLGKLRGFSRLQTTRFTGLLAGSIINTQQKKGIRTNKFGKRVGKLAYYRANKPNRNLRNDYNI